MLNSNILIGVSLLFTTATIYIFINNFINLHTYISIQTTLITFIILNGLILIVTKTSFDIHTKSIFKLNLIFTKEEIIN